MFEERLRRRGRTSATNSCTPSLSCCSQS